MSRRAGMYLGYLFLFAACLYGGGCNGCSGAPASFNKVTLSTANPTILQGSTSLISASVANDTNNGGVTWTLSGVGSLTNATKTTVTYSAPATVAAATTVTVHATSVDYASESSSIQILVEPTVAITTTSLPAGNYGSPYSATVNSIGGVGPFSWSIISGSLTSGLSLEASNSSSVTISGTPTAQTNSNFTIQIKDSTGAVATQQLSITIGAPLPLAVSTLSLPNGSINVAYSETLQATGGVPPFSWTIFSGSFPPGLALGTDGTITGTPTQIGDFSFTVEVSDSENPASKATKALSITVSNLGALDGNYAFEFNGFTSTGSAISVAGSFTADGEGNITNGVEDVNGTNATPKNQTFTGTYTVGADNRGTLTFSSLTNPPVYAFSISSTGFHGRLVEFDSSGTRGSGDMEFRTVSACTAGTFNGYYAFGLVGQQIAVSGISAAGPDVIVGSFSAAGAIPPGTSGSIGPGELDANTPVRVTTQDDSVSGSFQATSQATHCSMSISSTVQTMNFSVYPISSSESFMVETDTVNSTTPVLTAGTIQQQVGAPFVAGPGQMFTGTSVAALTGFFPSGNTYVPDIGLMVLSGTGTSSFTMNAIENEAGNVTPYQIEGTFEQADAYGRVETNIITPPFAPVFYMINQNTAYCLGELLNQSQPNPFFGVVQPQSTGPFSASSIASTTSFVEGTTAPSEPAVQDVSGFAQFTDTNSTTGTLAGTEDQSTSKANNAAQNVAGTYTITNSAAGTGTIAFTAPGVASGAYVIVSPSEVLMITTTTSDADPTIFIFQQ